MGFKRSLITQAFGQVEAKYDPKVQKLRVTLVKCQCPSSKKILYVEQVSAFPFITPPRSTLTIRPLQALMFM